MRRSEVGTAQRVEDVAGGGAHVGPRPFSSAVTITAEPSAAHVTDVGQRSQFRGQLDVGFTEAKAAQRDSRRLAGVECVSPVNATAVPSGEIAECSRSASGSSAIVVRSPAATSTRTSVPRIDTRGPGSCQDVTTKLPSSLTSSRPPAGRHPDADSDRAALPHRAGAAGPVPNRDPSNEPDIWCAAPPTSCCPYATSSAACRRRRLAPLTAAERPRS